MKSFASLSRLAIVGVFSLAALALAPAYGQTFTILHYFPATASDGLQPWSNLILDGEGNLYGTTLFGGSNTSGGEGTIFKIDSSGNESLLYIFAGPDGDGAQPFGPIVRFGESLYGTTTIGSKHGDCARGGCGTIFRWTAGHTTVLHSFDSTEANDPTGLTGDPLGNLYGATTYGGVGKRSGVCAPEGCGAIFEYSQGQESVLYSFLGPPDGEIPNAGFVVDPSGNIYGTTEYGGAFNYGTVFELSRSSEGAWSETVLYSFRGRTDGGRPVGGLIADAKGNLYGTTAQGGLKINCQNGAQGKPGCGVVYKMAKNPDGSWTERPLYRFGATTGDAYQPWGNLVRDKHGNLYGVTAYAGTEWGSVFELDTEGNEKVLHTFTGADGEYPASLTMDASGNLYGVAALGGQSSTAPGCGSGCGVVFKITP